MQKEYRLHCETCGGSLRYAADGKSAVCPYCGNEYHFKENCGDALVLSLNRANALRRNNDFEGAALEYRLVTASDPQCAEAWWGLALSRYGVEYIEDPRTHRHVPICRRTVRQSILQDESYLNALRTAAPEQCALYRARAEQIDRLQSAVKARIEQEPPYDVFLSFRSETDAGDPAPERAVALQIYEALSARGIRTFCSEVTLRGRLGEEYEPIIYKALYSCKVFILIAMSEENIHSPWVRSEWTRFCERVYDERLTEACFAVFGGIEPSALPSFLRAQGVDLSKYPNGGYAEEIAAALAQKLQKGGFAATRRAPDAPAEENGKAVRPPAKAAPRGNAANGDALGALLAQGERALREGDFILAAASFSRAIEEDAENGQAWLGAFLAEIEVRELGVGTRFARQVCSRLYSYGRTAAECRERLSLNERRVAVLRSPYYKNALRYSHGDVMDSLVAGKQQIFCEAEACNASLLEHLRRCERQEAPHGAPPSPPPPRRGGFKNTVEDAANWLLGRRRPPRGPYGRRRFARPPRS